MLLNRDKYLNSPDIRKTTKNVELSSSRLYFKIGLDKFSKKFPTLKNSVLSSHYFKNYFKVIKNVCKAKANLLI